MAVTTSLPSSASSASSFGATLEHAGFPVLARAAVTTLQINVGKVCNQACQHCHVEAGPKRTERMSAQVFARVIAVLKKSRRIDCVDITGGAPELNENFRELVTVARSRGLHVIDRCNLTVMFEPGMSDLGKFLAEQGVHVVASMPCYQESNVDEQRGGGVFKKSIAALQQLGELGYGKEGSGLELDLVYNPTGAFLPPPQAALEADYKREFHERFGISFNRLLTLTNMPIKRFATYLRKTGKLRGYMQLLQQEFNPITVSSLMCRDMVSVGWDGQLFDCDFNQMLEIGMEPSSPQSVFDLDSFDELADQAISTASHCFGCTAGAGSSCGGTLT